MWGGGISCVAVAARICPSTCGVTAGCGVGLSFDLRCPGGAWGGFVPVCAVPCRAVTPCLFCRRRPGPGAAAAGGGGPRAPAPAPAPGGPRALPDVPAAALRAAHRLPGRVRLRRRRGGRRRQEQQQELQHRRPAAQGPQARRGPGALTRFGPGPPPAHTQPLTRPPHPTHRPGPRAAPPPALRFFFFYYYF